MNRREDYLFELVDVGRPSPLVACLAKGWRPGIMGVSDEHGPVKRDDALGKGRSGMWVGELSPVGVREAMRKRCFFATRVKGLRLDAAANGVRMGQAFAHPGGRVLIQLDLATGGEHAGRTLNCHVVAPPADGELLPAILAEQVVTLPTEVIEFTVDVDPERHPWFAVRISEPGADSGAGLGFEPDGRATGTAYEPLGAAWAYTSPWYLDPSAPSAPASGRAPLTEPPDDPASPPSDEPQVNPVVTRRAGPGRVETAVALSQATFVEGVDTVFIANGGAFPDALAGGTAAATVPGPVLLVAADAVPSAVVEELQRLRPRRIVVLGGPAAVSDAVEARLRDLAEVVQRLAGDDRYGTAAAVSDAVFPDGAEEVWVASGETFADALPGGPAVAQIAGPLLLTARDALPAVTEGVLQRLGPDRIVVLGGTAAVSEAVVAQLEGIAPTVRVAGEDRYDTAGLVSQRVFLAARSLVVASGEDFPDALAAGPVAFVGSGPVLLVRRDDIPAATDAELRRLKPEVITIAGGTAAVSEQVQRALEAYDIR
jgi:putative cell wall-binding protein